MKHVIKQSLQSLEVYQPIIDHQECELVPMANKNCQITPLVDFCVSSSEFPQRPMDLAPQRQDPQNVHCIHPHTSHPPPPPTMQGTCTDVAQITDERLTIPYRSQDQFDYNNHLDVQNGRLCRYFEDLGFQKANQTVVKLNRFTIVYSNYSNYSNYRYLLTIVSTAETSFSDVQW